MKTKILLSGATGFLGSHLLKNLIRSGYEIVILVRENSNEYRIKNLNGFYRFTIDYNLSNLDELFKIHNVNTIIHLATEYGRDLPTSSVIHSNVLMPIKLIEASRANNIRLFINTDSYFCKFHKYGYLQDYINSKIFFKNYLKSISGFKVVNMQLEHLFGEHDSITKSIPSLISRMLKNEESIELSEGDQKRDFIYVSDVVDAYLLVLKKQDSLKEFENFEVGLGEAIPFKTFIKEIHGVIGSKSNLKFGLLPTRDNEIAESRSNNKNLIKLGWTPRFTINSALSHMLKDVSI